MSSPVERGLILFQLGQFKKAEQEFGNAIAHDPTDPVALSLLAVCCSNNKKRKEAVEHASRAIALNPDFPYAHYALAYCLSRAGKQTKALQVIEEAIRLDPEDADYWALMAHVFLVQGTGFRHLNAQKALDCAMTGLRLDARNLSCMRVRARALVALNRKDEARAALVETLSVDADDFETHELHAWLMLSNGDIDSARQHYQDALRLNPDSSSSREGLLASLRAQNFIYRALLRVMNADGSLKFASVALAVLAPVGVAYLDRIPNPICHALFRALMVPIFFGTILFVFILFLANPLFNMFLRFSPVHSAYLGPDERLAANLFACWAAVTVSIILFGLCTGSILTWIPGVVVALTVFPTVLIFEFPEGIMRKILYWYLALNYIAAAGSGLVFALDAFESMSKQASMIACYVWGTSIGISILMSLLIFYIGAIADRILVIRQKYF